MKVILLTNVPKQGKKDDVINVSDGYGNNYLIKNKLAVLATPENMKKLEYENKKRAKNEEDLIAEMEKLKAKLEKETLTFVGKVGKEDKLFGSISVKQIIASLKDKGYNLSKEQIIIDNPINSLGSHLIKLTLHKKVVATLKVVVER